MYFSVLPNMHEFFTALCLKICGCYIVIVVMHIFLFLPLVPFACPCATNLSDRSSVTQPKMGCVAIFITKVNHN